jgi:hypothetical protein
MKIFFKLLLSATLIACIRPSPSEAKAIDANTTSYIYKFYLKQFEAAVESPKPTSAHAKSNAIRFLNLKSYYRIRRVSDHKYNLQLHRSIRKNFNLTRILRASLNDTDEAFNHAELIFINNLKLNLRVCFNKYHVIVCKVFRRKFLLRIRIDKFKNFLSVNILNGGKSRRVSFFLVAHFTNTRVVKPEPDVEDGGIGGMFDKFSQPVLIGKRQIRYADDDDDGDSGCKRVVQTVNFDKIGMLTFLFAEKRVDFHWKCYEIGWKRWIIEPLEYIAYRCVGECSFKTMSASLELKNTNHSIVQSVYSWLKSEQHIVTSCCAPVRYKPLYLLNYDSNMDIVMRQYSNMVVDKCGCR